MRSASPGFGKDAARSVSNATSSLKKAVLTSRSPMSRNSPVNSASGKARTCDGSRSFSTRLYASACSGPLVNTSMTATRPPGRQTRSISASTAFGSRKWWKE